MDIKLEEYRRRKAREEFLRNTKEKIKSLFSKQRSEVIETHAEKPLIPPDNSYPPDEITEVSSDILEDESLNCCRTTDLVYYGLCFVLWLCVFYVFITWSFGTVYLILSLLVGMYLNTRTTPRKPNEISAYSVFNENCESIDGTLKGEQFEREMGYRI